MTEQPWYFSLSKSTFIFFPKSNWSCRVWWAFSLIRVHVMLLERQIDGAVTQADSQWLLPRDIPSPATNTSFISSQQVRLVSKDCQKGKKKKKEKKKGQERGSFSYFVCVFPPDVLHLLSAVSRSVGRWRVTPLIKYTLLGSDSTGRILCIYYSRHVMHA